MVPIDQIDQIRNYLQMPRTYLSLRNDIVHSTWTDALSQNAVRPLWLSHGPQAALKPVHDIDNTGEPDWFKDAERTKISGLADVPLAEVTMMPVFWSTRRAGDIVL